MDENLDFHDIYENCLVLLNDPVVFLATATKNKTKMQLI